MGFATKSFSPITTAEMSEERQKWCWADWDTASDEEWWEEVQEELEAR